jgi:putative flippase GtrA
VERVRPSIWISLRRSQVSSLVATLIDFGTLVFLVEVFKLWYVTATAIGAFVGAVTNFTFGRHWSFKATDGLVHHQVVKYSLISGTSLILNSLGVYFLTDGVGLKYTESKVVTAILIGLLFNFPLHRVYVFR